MADVIYDAEGDASIESAGDALGISTSSVPVGSWLAFGTPEPSEPPSDGLQAAIMPIMAIKKSKRFMGSPW